MTTFIPKVIRHEEITDIDPVLTMLALATQTCGSAYEYVGWMTQLVARLRQYVLETYPDDEVASQDSNFDFLRVLKARYFPDIQIFMSQTQEANIAFDIVFHPDTPPSRIYLDNYIYW